MTAPSPSATLHQLAAFNALDWLLVLVVAWSAVVALFRGLIREIFGLAGTILGLLLACWNYPSLALWLSRWISSPFAADATAFLLIAIGVLVACTLLGRLVRGTAHTVGLGLLDRLAGTAFGILRGALIGLGIVVTATTFFPANLAQNSRLAPYFLAAAREVSFVVPQVLQKRITGSIDGIRHIARR
jgi:membrane protein required for colicin V production